MKNRIAYVITVCGLGMATIGVMGAGTEDRTGFAMAMLTGLLGMAIAGTGWMIEKRTSKKSVSPWKSTRSHDYRIGKKPMSGLYQTGGEK